MRLLSWLDAGVWSTLPHISHLGEPLCDTPVPDKPQGRRERAAEIRDWPYICLDCKALAIKGATGDDVNEPVLHLGRADA